MQGVAKGEKVVAAVPDNLADGAPVTESGPGASPMPSGPGKD